MAKIKNGVFFSIASILIVVLFAALTNLIFDFSIGESKIEITRTRVRILNSLVNDMEDVYFERLIYVAAKNAIIGLSEYYDTIGYNNVERTAIGAINDTIKNGVLKDRLGSPIDLVAMGFIDARYTVDGLIAGLSSEFTQLGVDITKFQLDVIDVSQPDPWHIDITVKIFYNFNDNNNMAGWKGETIRKVRVTVFGLYLRDGQGGQGYVNLNDWIEESYGFSWEPSVLEKLSGKSTDADTILDGICISGCYIP